MRSLVVVENVSLDGVMQGPARPDEDTRGGFTAGGWAVPFMARDPDAAMASMEGRGETTAMLFGRFSYEDMCGYWLNTPDPNPYTEIFRSTPKYVASTTLTEPLEYPSSILLQGDAVEAVRRLKADGDGAIAVLGSGDLVRQLLSAGLVDELVLTTVPVVLGQGVTLFGETPATLEAVRVRAFDSGITVGHYRVTR